MGPRLVGRGKVFKHPVRNWSWDSFNGAASCGTRKGQWPPVQHWENFGLQWGRVLWDAERAAEQHMRILMCVLQWGRVLWDAERMHAAMGDLWRFGFNGAASCGTRKDRWTRWVFKHPVRFNGAASCGTRKEN